MVFDINQLKKIRKQLNLTQHQLSQKIGISQSMIAKIESSKLDPTYSYVKKIELAINELTKKEETTAEEIMHKKIISVKKETLLVEITKLLTKHSISQVLVIEKSHVLGIVTESNIIENEKNKTAYEVMQSSPPMIEKITPLSVVTSLLKFYPLIIVKDRASLAGVITKADILKTLT